MLLHILQRKNYFKWLLDQHMPTLLSGIGSENKELWRNLNWLLSRLVVSVSTENKGLTHDKWIWDSWIVTEIIFCVLWMQKTKHLY